ncbi:MAG: BACON domain-containing protein [Muribaculaceae bacterium]
MKLKYILPAFIAMFAALVSCSDEDEVKLLDEVRVSSSYVALPVDGGNNTITVNAVGDWSIDASSVPEWLTISPMNGSKGETSVQFSADKTVDGRTAELLLNCGSVTQRINVIQGLAEVSDATCAEVIAGPESKTYRVTGVVTAIANTSYGNFYMNDGTGQIYIYGTVDASGQYNWAKFGIEVGDEVTVQGPKTTYNGVVELVDATFISVNKSLIKVESSHLVGDEETTVIPLEGGEYQINLSCKGQGVSLDIPEDAKSWLSIQSIQSTSGAATVIVKAAENKGGDRSTKLVFHTTDGKKDYTAELAISQKGAILEVSIAEFNAASVGDTFYRISGVISNVYNEAKGRFYVKDWSGETYVYNMANFADAGVKAGDIVTIVGKRDQYNDVIEMTSAYFESTIPVTEVSIAEFLTKDDSKEVFYMITGTITEIKNSTYGNLYITDGNGNTVYVYGCYSGYGATGDNRKEFLGNNNIVVGDKVTMIGYKATYNGEIEICGGTCFSFEHAVVEE